MYRFFMQEAVLFFASFMTIPLFIITKLVFNKVTEQGFWKMPRKVQVMVLKACKFYDLPHTDVLVRNLPTLRNVQTASFNFFLGMLLNSNSVVIYQNPSEERLTETDQRRVVGLLLLGVGLFQFCFEIVVMQYLPLSSPNSLEETDNSIDKATQHRRLNLKLYGRAFTSFLLPAATMAVTFLLMWGTSDLAVLFSISLMGILKSVGPYRREIMEGKALRAIIDQDKLKIGPFELMGRLNPHD